MSLDGNLQLGFQQVAATIKTKISLSEKGAINGVATLGSDGKVPSTQLPSYVDDVLEGANLAAFPAEGELNKIYVALDTNNVYRWSGTVYVKITSGEVSSVAGRTGVVVLTKNDVGLSNVDNTSDADKPVSTAQGTAIALKTDITDFETHTSDANNPHSVTKAQVGLSNVTNESKATMFNSPTFTGTVSGVTKAMVGLDEVDNTADADKPVSTATQTELDLKAPLANPAFTGTVSGVTKGMVGLGNADNTSDANKPVSIATQTELDLKAPLASPTFTGTVSGITKTMVGLGNVDNTSDVNKPVSTAQQTALDLKANLASPTFTGTVSGITKSMVGLGNVDNTADLDKPISTATQTAITTLSNNVGATDTDYVAVFNAAMA